MKPSLIPLLIFASLLPVPAAVSIDTVYFAQTHVLKPDNPYFGLVGNREVLLKAHVVDPDTGPSPVVTAILSLNGETLNVALTGPAVLPASIPDGPGVVQHSFENSFTALLPATWIKPGLEVSVTAGPASTTFTNLKVGAPTKVIMTMFDVQYFADTDDDYPSGWQEELEAKWPVAELEVRRLPHLVFPELVIPPRGGVAAARVRSPSEYLLQTGIRFDGEQAAALSWNGALKRAAGRQSRLSLYYINIYNVGAGGQAGGFSGVGNGTSAGILHHELGHALSLPHWGNSSSYPYRGPMHGIDPPVGNEVHAGPAWAFDLPSQSFIPPTVQPNNSRSHPPGTFKVDPMQGGGTGYQEPPFLLNHLSDYSVNQMRNYLEGRVVLWNDSLGSYASWDQSDAAYTRTVSNNGVDYPITRDVDVITIMASVSGANPDINMVYPPIGPYQTGLIRLFDPRIPADRAAARAIYAPSNGCDVSVRITQGGVEKIYMLPASLEPNADPLSSGSLETEAVNLPASDGVVTRIELLSTPDAEDNGLPASPEILYTWAPLTPDPASFAQVPSSFSSSTVSMSASPGALNIESSDPIEYLFTETSGNPEGSSSGWQTSPSYTDTDLQSSTSYSYTVSMRAGSLTTLTSESFAATTLAPSSARNIGVDSTQQFSLTSSNDLQPVSGLATFDADGADKLVVVVSTEHGFNNGNGYVFEVRYNGRALTEAVQEDAGPDQGTAAIFYLDDPGPIGTGTIEVNAAGPNGGIGAAYALSGTATGVGVTHRATGESVTSLTMTTAGDNSLVIAVIENSGNPNGSGTPTAIAPLTQVSSGRWGSNWGGHASGWQKVATPTTISPAFSTNSGPGYRINLAAAEFLAAPGDNDYVVWSSLYPDADLTDPNHDFDRDGLTNEVERIFGLDPTKGSSPEIFRAPVTPRETLTYTRRDDALTGKIFRIEVSISLEPDSWFEDLKATQVVKSLDDQGVETVEVTLDPNLLVYQTLFVRVIAE